METEPITSTSNDAPVNIVDNESDASEASVESGTISDVSVKEIIENINNQPDITVTSTEMETLKETISLILQRMDNVEANFKDMVSESNNPPPLPVPPPPPPPPPQPKYETTHVPVIEKSFAVVPYTHQPGEYVKRANKRGYLPRSRGLIAGLYKKF